MGIRRNAWGLEDFGEVIKRGREYRARNPMTAEQIAETKRLFPGWNPPEDKNSG